MAVCQNLVPLVNIKRAGKLMFIPLKMVLIGIDPYPNGGTSILENHHIPNCGLRHPGRRATNGAVLVPTSPRQAQGRFESSDGDGKKCRVR